MLVLLWACRLVFMVLVRKLTWFSRFLYHPHVQPGIYIDLLTQRVVDSLRLWEWSVGVNTILYYDPASQKGLVYKVFWKILSRQESEPQQARRIILLGWPSFLSPFITAWIEPKKAMFFRPTIPTGFLEAHNWHSTGAQLFSYSGPLGTPRSSCSHWWA